MVGMGISVCTPVFVEAADFQPGQWNATAYQVGALVPQLPPTSENRSAQRLVAYVRGQLS